MLASVALRREVPIDEQFSQLPFKIHDLGGFRTVRTLTPGRVMLLSDGEGDDAVDHPTSMVVSFGQGAPNSAEDRGRFAQFLMGALPGLKNIRFTLSEPMRLGTAPGFETRMEAVRQIRYAGRAGAVASLRHQRLHPDGRRRPARRMGERLIRACARSATASKCGPSIRRPSRHLRRA